MSLTAAALLIGAFLVPTSAHAAAPDNYPELADSSELSTPVVVDGTLKDSAGADLAGQQVVLFAWPSNDAMQYLREGDSIKLQPVAKASTDAAGRFQMRLRAMADLKPQVAHDGVVNLEVLATGTQGIAAFNFGRALRADADGEFLTDPSSAPAPGTARRNQVAHALMRANGASTGNDTSDEARYSKGCTSTLVVDYGVKNGIVGQTNSQTTGVVHDFTYTSGASSSLGVGVSASGSYGSFSASGTNSQSSTSTWGFASQGNNIAQRYLTGWRFGKFSLYCYAPGCACTTYQAQTFSFAGGVSYQSVGFPGASLCVNFGAGGDFTKASYSAYNFVTGLSVAAVIGIDLSIHTGYSAEAKIHYHNNNGTSRTLCGGGDYPAGNTSFVVAKN
ncbi:MAG: hypothetical protein QOE05_1251 [Actinomycetota bacterium]|jgi:hypothetical protein|nr:hypothetical protein [Actinomycetota bacterium]